MKTSLAVSLLMFSAAAHAQSVTFRFTSAQTPQSLVEAATILRTVAELRQVSVDEAQSSLTFPQSDMGSWILGQLDRTGNENSVLEYKAPVGDNVVRVNFLPNVGTAQAMQELLTVLRTVADITKIFNFTSRHALVVRAKSSDMAFAEWIIDQLNLPAGAKVDATARVYPALTPRNMVARVNYLTNISGAKETQQLLSILRIVADIAKVFNYTQNQRILVLRAAQPDIDRAEWLIQELNQAQAPQNAGTQTYQSPSGDDVTRVLFLTNASEQQLSADVNAIRNEAKVPKVFYMDSPAAVVVRGTADQVEAAVQAMARRNGLAD